MCLVKNLGYKPEKPKIMATKRAHSTAQQREEETAQQREEETCNRQDYENIQVKPSWLAEEYLEEYRKNPNWPRKSPQQSVMERFGVRIQRFACYNVRKPINGLRKRSTSNAIVFH
ncbi:unnamed protein product [Cuscuta europaea]|uniref:Uncharacterized protein n=1 Tax=Cuscuta europaea TaxID=41803 RepID=A0A9P1EM86_CUSEU|nr:unnamed protein product [Cuscuta europaea]